jgi:transcriptional regulator
MVLPKHFKLVLLAKPILEYPNGMYIPRHTEMTDRAVLYDHMRAHSFATIINVIEGVPFATHMPVKLDAERGVLVTHVARANPQWKYFSSETEILIIFQGDHGYISPKFYATNPNVPTWNYMTVHAYAKPRILENPVEVRAVLHDLVHEFEGANGWDMNSLTDEYIQGMMKGLVAFELEITRLEGKFKLSQNKAEADQRGVIANLERATRAEEKAVAQHMRHNLEKGQTP